MEERIWTCECGCKKKAMESRDREGWLILSQVEVKKITSDPKLNGNLHFATLECLMKWTKKVVRAVAELQPAAEMFPRGQITRPDISGFHI